MSEPGEILDCDACNGELTFNATGALPAIDLLNGFAWCATDLSDLWKLEVRGGDRTIPGLEGERAYPLLRHSVVMQFPMVIVGKRTRLGALNADERAGLATNLAYLRTNLELPLTTGDGTRPVTWIRDDGVTLLADAKVLPPLQHQILPGAVCRAVLTIKIPTGAFTVTGS